MSGFFKYLSVALLSCVCAFGARAQVYEPLDSLGVDVDSLAMADTTDYGDIFDDDSLSAADTNKMRQKDYGIDAVKYTLQKRWRPQNDLFVNKKFMDNTFFALHAGAMVIVPVKVPMERMVVADANLGGKEKLYEEFAFTNNDFVGLDFGKWLDRNNALRVSLEGGTLVRNADSRRFVQAGLDVSHLFNMVSYLKGYRPSRFCELSTVVGVRYKASMMMEEKNGPASSSIGNLSHVFGAYAGFNIAMTLGRYVDLFVEPLAYYENLKPFVEFEKVALKTGEDDRRYNAFAPGLKFGLLYNVVPKEANWIKPAQRPGSRFLSLAGGLQLENSGAAGQNGLLRVLGPHGMISYGRSYAGDFKIRASLFGSMDVWQYGYNLYISDFIPWFAYYGGLRLEFMYNILNFFPAMRGDFPLEFSLLFGPEAGVFLKQEFNYKASFTTDMSFKGIYFGFTGGAQLKLRIAGPVAFILEPRVSVIPYSVPIFVEDKREDDVDYRGNYFASLFSANAGLEFTLGRRTKEERTALKEEKAARAAREKMAKQMEKEEKAAAKGKKMKGEAVEEVQAEVAKREKVREEKVKVEKAKVEKAKPEKEMSPRKAKLEAEKARVKAERAAEKEAARQRMLEAKGKR